MPFLQDRETQPIRDLGQSSNSNLPPLGQRQQQSHQQPSSYPSVMDYPGYPNPNPSPQYNYQYAYAQAPLPNYYGSSNPTNQNPGYWQPTPTGIVRGILAGVAVLVILFYFSYFIKWLIFQPQLPIFTLTNFAVSGFNVTGPIFTAQWTANLTIENSNLKLKAYLDEIHCYIYHQKWNNDHQVLSTTFSTSMYIDAGKTTKVVQRLNADEKEDLIVPSWEIEDMKKERATGMVQFSLRISALSTLKTKEVSMGNNMIGVFCLGLKVTFEGDSGNGILSLPKPLRCLAHV